MLNTSWEPFVFFWEPVSSRFGVITVLVLGMVVVEGGVYRELEKGEKQGCCCQLAAVSNLLCFLIAEGRLHWSKS